MAKERPRKKCSGKCKGLKPLSEFPRDSTRSDGRYAYCKECRSEFRRKHYRDNPEERRKIYARHLKYKYNLTYQEYEALHAEQDGRCAICEDEVGLIEKHSHVDHCHDSGIVRGILCRACNHLIGGAKDRTDILHSAIRYLERFEDISNA